MTKNEDLSFYVNKLREVLDKDAEEYKKIRTTINKVFNLKENKKE